MAILPFSAMFLTTLKGFIYTITMYFYAFHLAISTISPCILHQNALRFAPKHTAFCTKTRCVYRHIAPRLAPKHTAFCCKSPQNEC